MIRCYKENYARSRYANRPPEYREAMESCIVPDAGGEGMVCYDDQSEGWKRAVEVAEKKDDGKFIGIGKSISRVAKGAVGLTQVASGIGLADDDEVKRRLSICDSCPVSTPADKPVEERACGKLFKEGASPSCGCWLRKKTKLKNQSCPQGKW